jgi:CspA family cold shock protein
MSTSTDKATSSATERFTGRVKWFNNKAGYGFITITDGSRSGTDIFVHHSVIGVGSQQFRYLVQGEYVEFDLVPTIQGSTHEIQASNVCGIKGGKLMCETRNEYKASKPSSTDLTDKPTFKQFATDKQFATNKPTFKPSSERFSEPVKMPRQKSVNTSNTNGWTTVDKRQKNVQTQGKK